jgi:hypothetical protein
MNGGRLDGLANIQAHTVSSDDEMAFVFDASISLTENFDFKSPIL